MKKTIHANGKLLLSSEYFVLDGAKALALPCVFGQNLDINSIENDAQNISWKSFDLEEKCWFECSFDLKNKQISQTSDVAVSDNLVQIFEVLQALNPVFFEKKDSFEFETMLEFPRNWGLGSSSTLIYALAKWANVDAYQLLEKTMGGSGYDIACAGVNHPILFEKTAHQIYVEKVDFQPAFAEQLYFVFLGKKQNSREGIARYRARIDKNHVAINYFTQLTNDFLTAKNSKDFEKTILEHEQLIAQLLDLPRAKDLYFPDYQGEIKSLGAWGGDFVLATSEMSDTETKSYFKNKGFETVLKYNEMVIF